MSAEAIHLLGLPKKHLPTHVKPSVHYQTQTGDWADPSGTGWENGDLVVVYNSTQVGHRLYVRSNDAWYHIPLL